ncbi:MAG: hypothetical protein K2O11_06240 [Oscillospiraceae bacterium]|nr:hypothetical protein [Oscillospiraceae bacterium]
MIHILSSYHLFARFDYSVPLKMKKYNGNLDGKPNLRAIIEARREVGHNFLAGAAADHLGVSTNAAGHPIHTVRSDAPFFIMWKEEI